MPFAVVFVARLGGEVSVHMRQVQKHIGVVAHTAGAQTVQPRRRGTPVLVFFRQQRARRQIQRRRKVAVFAAFRQHARLRRSQRFVVAAAAQHFAKFAPGAQVRELRAFKFGAHIRHQLPRIAHRRRQAFRMQPLMRAPRVHQQEKQQHHSQADDYQHLVYVPVHAFNAALNGFQTAQLQFALLFNAAV